VSRSALFHLVSAIAWIPFTVVIFVLGLQGAVVIVFLLSVYANIKTDLGDYHAARAQHEE
jgi:ABC-type nitrate/sulfonate/bicarbonate transport system permease component